MPNNSDIELLPEFDNHRLVVFLQDKKNNLRGFIAIHRADLKHPAFGATRLWHYADETEALKDALKLSKAMSYKSALAGISYGGGKGVLLDKIFNTRQKHKLLSAYSDRVNYLGGHFVTGTDVGLDKKDVAFMSRSTPFVTGLKVDPSRFTAVGLFYAIKVCLKEIFNSDEIEGRSFAIQGVGKVGGDLLSLIYPHAKDVFVSDVDPEALKKIKKHYPKVKVVTPDDIHKQKVDVFSPCALSNGVNSKVIPQLSCKIICGGG